jgi:GNAT superfamily N-acetyltransferase
MGKVKLRRFEPDDAPWLVDLHGAVYAHEEGFDDSFAGLVANILRDFVARHDPARECGWIAHKGKHRLGSIFCVDAGDGQAKLRLFILSPDARGKGLGKRLLKKCMTYARKTGYREMVLWTHESHEAACALYAAFGWQLEGSKPVRSFGVDLVEQSWRIDL